MPCSFQGLGIHPSNQYLGNPSVLSSMSNNGEFQNLPQILPTLIYGPPTCQDELRLVCPSIPFFRDLPDLT